MSIRSLVNSCCVVFLLTVTANLIRADELEANRKPSPLKADAEARRAFQARDTSGDGKLSEQEFVLAASAADRPLVKRDFRLLDFDHDGFMTLEEFRNVPYLVPAEERGQMPDPLARLVETHFQQSARVWVQSDANNDDLLDRNEFNEAKADLLRLPVAPPRFWVVNTLIDRDGDGCASRDEWKWFLEAWYGVRRPNGELLRTPSGLTVNWLLFRTLDRNYDGRADHDEYVKFGLNDDVYEKRFQETNTNHDGAPSYAEWAASAHWRIDLFRQVRMLDTNLDARIDRDELLKNIADWQKSIAVRMFPAFDTDRDGFLSLEEFALTPLHNQFQEWNAIRTDRDGDGRLDFTDFQFDAGPSQMGLTAEYFKLLDTNLNGALDPADWSFQIIEPPKSRLFAMNADGSDVELLADAGLFDATYLGSPDWSPDGTTVVFDATPPRGTNSDFSKSLIVSLSLAGPAKGESKRLGYGNCPDWSPDVPDWEPGGNSLCVSLQLGNQRALCLIDITGDQDSIIELWKSDLHGIHDNSRPNCSQDGREIIFADNSSGKSVLKRVVTTGDEEPVVVASQLSHIDVNAVWSPDRKRIIFCSTQPLAEIPGLKQPKPK
ncbi:MAG TPA: EF-hand domain-containing protein [Planctomycetaceae bacterium]|jgi:Ca2+-binding EF-hand superfamily protein